jgi:hypothetical protein
VRKLSAEKAALGAQSNFIIGVESGPSLFNRVVLCR